MKVLEKATIFSFLLVLSASYSLWAEVVPAPAVPPGVYVVGEDGPASSVTVQIGDPRPTDDSEEAPDGTKHRVFEQEITIGGGPFWCGGKMGTVKKAGKIKSHSPKPWPSNEKPLLDPNRTINAPPSCVIVNYTKYDPKRKCDKPYWLVFRLTFSVADTKTPCKAAGSVAVFKGKYPTGARRPPVKIIELHTWGISDEKIK